MIHQSVNMTTHLFIFACTCEQKGKITFLDKIGNFLNGSSMCKLLFFLKKIKWCKVYIQCEESEVEVKKLPNKILMPSHGSISKLNSFTIGCNLHSSPRAWQYKVKVKVFMLTFITSEKMNITFKTHLFPLLEIFSYPAYLAWWSKESGTEEWACFFTCRCTMIRSR